MEITDNCPLNCLHCSSEAGIKGGMFWTREDVAHYLGRYPDFDTVRLSGGEPFQHPDLVGILRMIHDGGRRSVVLSSGVWNPSIDSKGEFGAMPIPSKALAQAKPYLDEIVFSIHGFYDVHDRIVCSDHNPYRHPPFWDIMCDTTDNCREVGIFYSYQCVLMRSNFDNLKEIFLSMMCDMKSRGASHLHLLRYVKQGRGAQHGDEVLTEDQLARLPGLIREYSDLVASGWGGMFEPVAGLKVTQTNSFDMQGCDCEVAKAVVTASKEEIPCSALKKCGGSKEAFACKYRI